MKTVNSNFKVIKRDFDSSQVPSPYDPQTVRTLCRIVNDIKEGKTTLKEFEDYLTQNEIGRLHKVPYFGDACYDFVSNVLQYLENERKGL